MGAQVRYGTIAVGAYGAHWPGSHQAAFGDQYHSRWDRGGARSPRTWRDPARWASLWPTSRFAGGSGGAGTDAMFVVGQGLECSGMYEPYSCDGGGTQSIKFVLGMCVDASDVAIADATVQGFVSSTDAFTGEGVSRADGSYAVPTQNPGVAHYVVAYKAGSPDIGGTTVNTLTPTNLDGT